MKLRTAVSPSESSKAEIGFARMDLMLLAAFLVILLAVAIPEGILHGAWRGLLAALRVGMWTGALLVVFLAWVWLLDGGNGQRSGWQATLWKASGALLRLLMSGLIAAILGSALAAGHGLGAARENRIALVFCVSGGLAGGFLSHWLGASRFWATFRRFCAALLGSFVLGILGLLLPWNWGPDLGILLPLLVFTALALSGRIVPPREAALTPAPSPPLEQP